MFATQAVCQAQAPLGGMGRETVGFKGRQVSALRVIAKLKGDHPRLDAKGRGELEASLDEADSKLEDDFGGLLVLQQRDDRAAESEIALQGRIAALLKSGMFEYVEPDWVVYPDQLPADDQFTDGSLWGLQNTGQDGGMSGVDVNAVPAWTITHGTPDTVVAVIDTGVRYTHQDLAANMWTNPGEIGGNGIDDDGNGYIDDVHGIDAISGSGDPMDPVDEGHGTHVSGTIAAVANNAGGHVGVAYGTRIMALKFLGTDGGFTSDGIECLHYAVNHGAQITNNSWGGGGPSQAMRDAILAAREAGVLFVAAAGNDGTDNDLIPHYPSSYRLPNVISVAAVDRHGEPADFTNFGRFSVDIAAPGVDIHSCVSISDTSYDRNNGTSMAAPHVAGVAALVRSQFPGESPESWKNRILHSSKPLSPMAGLVASAGLVDAGAALLATVDGTMEVSAEAHSQPLVHNAESAWSIEVSDLTMITGASVTASFSGEPPVAFFDNGVEPDRIAGDGLYSASLVTPSGGETATLHVHVMAPGKAPLSKSLEFAIKLPPVYDDFEQAFELSSGSGVIYVETHGATGEAGEPDHAGESAPLGSVWAKWTAPSDGSLYLLSHANYFDFFSTMAVYTGAEVSSLTEVASGTELLETGIELEFDVLAGETYRVAIDSVDGEAGSVRLVSNFIPNEAGLANDDFADRIPLNGDVVSVSGSNIGATYQEGETSVSSPTASVWWSWTPATSGLFEIDTFGSEIDTAMLISVGTEVDDLAWLAFNDDADDSFQSRVVVAAVAGQSYHIQIDGYRFHEGAIDLNIRPAPVDGSLVADAGPDQLVKDDESDEVQGYQQVLLDGSGSSVGTGEIMEWLWGWEGGSASGEMVEPWFTPGVHLVHLTIRDDQGRFATDSVTVVVRPENDDFEDALPLPPVNGSTFGWAAGGTGEAGEPDHAGSSSPLASVWYSWTAPANGLITVRTSSGGTPMALAAYTGNSVATLTELDSDSTDRFNPFLYFDVSAGVQYWFAVDGVGDESGWFDLTSKFYPDSADLPNDDFAGRIPLEGDDHSVNGSNVGASKEFGEPDHAGVSDPNSSVWWSWTPETTGTFVVDTIGSDFDTTLAIYSGSSVDALSWLCSNDQHDGDQAGLAIDVIAGQAYQIAVDGYQYLQGQITLNIAPAPVNGELIADAGPDLEVVGTSDYPGRGIADLSASYSGLSSEGLAYVSWSTPIGDVYGSDIETLFPVGVTPVHLTVVDRDGSVATDTLMVRVLHEGGGASTALFSEDFNDAPVGVGEWEGYNDWAKWPPTEVEVDEVLASSPVDRYARLGGHPPFSSDDYSQMYRSVYWGGERATISFRGKLEAGSVGNLGDFSLILDDSEWNGVGEIWFYCDDSEVNLYFCAAGAETCPYIGSISYNQWHQFELYLDFKRNRISVDVDGSRLATDLVLSESPNQGNLGWLTFDWSYDSSNPSLDALSLDDLSVTGFTDHNLRPYAMAGADIVVGDSDGNGTESVVLDASDSYDSGGTLTSYQWDWPGGSASGKVVSQAFPTGTTSVTLTVTDDGGLTSTDELVVEVVAGEPTIVVEQPEGVILEDGVSIVDLGPQFLNTSGHEHLVTIKNAGTATLQNIAVQVDGFHFDEFVPDTAGMATTLPAGGSTTFAIHLHPLSAGLKYANLQILSTDPDTSTATFNLRGEGISADPLSFQVESINPVGTSSNQNGYVVAIDGTTMVVGYKDYNSYNGIAYIYAWDGSAWVFNRSFQGAAGGGNFGSSVAIDGDRIAVGERWADVGGLDGAGAVHIFVKSGGSWVPEDVVYSTNAHVGNGNGTDGFGFSVALSGDLLCVGAPFEESGASGIGGNQNDNSVLDAGAVYTFKRNGSDWLADEYVKSSSTAIYSLFGYSVDIEASTMVVGSLEGAHGTGENDTWRSGAAYVFHTDGSSWVQQARLTPTDRDAWDGFGGSVSLSGDTLAVGSGGEAGGSSGIGGNQADDTLPGAGAVYTYTRSGTVWSPEAYIKAPLAGSGDRFGSSVSLDGNALFVGAPSHVDIIQGPNHDLRNDGTVYLLERMPTGWTHRDVSSHASNGLGASTGLSGRWAVAGVFADGPRNFVIYDLLQATTPLFVGIDDNAVSENSVVGQGVGTLYAVDQNQSGGFIFDLVSGAGDEANELFNIVGDRLIVAPPPAGRRLDFETDPELSIRVRVTDADGQSFEDVLTIQVLDADDVAPLLVEHDPADGASGVTADVILRLEFNEAMRAGYGHFEIRNVLDGTLAVSVDVGSPEVAINGSTVFVDLLEPLLSGSEYYVLVPNGVIEDLSGNTFTLSDPTAWTFRTNATDGSDFLTHQSGSGDAEFDGGEGFDTLNLGPGVLAGDVVVTPLSGDPPRFRIVIGGTDTIEVTNVAQIRLADGTILPLVPWRAYAWGSNADGQLGVGIGGIVSMPTLVDPSGLLANRSLIGVSAGGAHTIGIGEDGKLYAWGANDRGQLGDGTTNPAMFPVEVDMSGALLGKRVVAVAAGGAFSLALTEDGRVYSWGANDVGQLGNGAVADSSSPVEIDMTGVLSGREISGISAGGSHGFALTTDGVPFSWGSNSMGQSGSGSPGLFFSSPVEVSQSGVLGGTTVVELVAGEDHGLARSDEGTLFAWGANSAGQLGDGTLNESLVPVLVDMSGDLAGKTITSIAAGGAHSHALSLNGRVYSWGSNSSGQLGVAVGAMSSTAVEVGGLLAEHSVIGIAAGEEHVVVHSDTGGLLAWGGNSSGQLGNRSQIGSPVPHEVLTAGALSGKTVLQVSAGGFHSVVIGEGGAYEPDLALEDAEGAELFSGASSVSPGGVLPGGSSVSTVVTVRNHGTEELGGLAITIAGQDAAQFAADTSGMLLSLPPGGETKFRVAFTASRVGEHSAKLYVSSNDPDEHPFEVDLLAEGFGPYQFENLAYLKANNPGSGDGFGSDVAVDGDWMVIGAPNEDGGTAGVGGAGSDNSAANAGAAYVFRRVGDVWVYETNLKAINAGAGDRFGSSVAISGDTIVVGAPMEDGGLTGPNEYPYTLDNNASNAGAAYVYVRDAGGNWIHQYYLKASNTHSDDGFGSSVAISGDTVVVGAEEERNLADGVNGDQNGGTRYGSGAAYVFVRTGGIWSQEAYLKASDSASYDNFGSSVDVDGDTVIVGSPGEDGPVTGVNGNENATPYAYSSGAAYVFRRTAGNWSQEAYVKPSNTAEHQYFGGAVAIQGDTVVIGANREDGAAMGVGGEQEAIDHDGDGSTTDTDAGAAYVFSRSGATWVQDAYLKASNTGFGDYFGNSVDIEGDLIVVGATREDSGANEIDGDDGDAADHDTDGRTDDFDAGAAYVYSRGMDDWEFESYLKAPNCEALDRFGEQVALSATTIVVGAYLEDSSATWVDGDSSNNGAPNSGAAYAYSIEARVPRSEILLSVASAALTNGDSVPFDLTALGDERVLEFAILNNGPEEVTGLGVAKEAGGASAFSVEALANPVLGDGQILTFRVSFAPTLIGWHAATIRITSDNAEENPFDIILTGEGAEAETLLDSELAAAGLSGLDSAHDATPFNDGVSNLEKYAFNMNLAGPDSSSMTPGGDSGLPGGGLVEEGGQTYWRVEFVRRRGSGLIYTPKKSSTLDPDSFVSFGSTPDVQEIDGEWERVIYDEPCNPATESKCFSYVEVVLP